MSNEATDRIKTGSWKRWVTEVGTDPVKTIMGGLLGLVVIIGGLSTLMYGMPFASKQDLTSLAIQVNQTSASVDKLATTVQSVITSQAVQNQINGNQTDTQKSLESQVEDLAKRTETIEMEQKELQAEQRAYTSERAAHRHDP